MHVPGVLDRRQDPRVRLFEKTNARYLTREQLGQEVDLIAMDVSFISAALVLPAVLSAAFPEEVNARSGRELIVLVKPQFEVGRDLVGKGGIVRDPVAQEHLARLREPGEDVGRHDLHLIPHQSHELVKELVL